ncbi:hypothetical protein Q3A80_05390 [Burkholderia sp. SR8]|jgi:hypothetical protein|uniref:hypothetical protein n=1 Tax=Burkholderia sp. SR8 TaxID=3062277 RepID=UPI004062D29E
MTRRPNRNIANGAATTILRDVVQLVGNAATRMPNAFACSAPALALAQHAVAARRTDVNGRPAAGAA